MDRAELFQRIRDRIYGGELPCTRQAKTWGAVGSGQSCAACGEAIAPSEVELELDFLTANGVTTYPFHTFCWAVWELERRATPT